MTLPALNYFTDINRTNAEAKTGQDAMLAVLKGLYDSGNITAFAAITLAADKLVYATGAGALSQTSFTAFARSLLDDADAAAARATLGVKAPSEVTAYTKQQYAQPVAVTPSSGAVTLDAELHQDCEITSTQNLTMNAPTKAVKGMQMFIRLYAASAFTITWNAAFTNLKSGDSLPTVHVAGKGLYCNFRYNGSKWVLMFMDSEV